MEGKKLLLSLNGEPLGISTPVTLKPDSEWEFYLKQDNTCYFRHLLGATISIPNPTGLENLKYGDKVNLDFDVEA